MFWKFCEDPENPSPDLEDWPGTCQWVKSSCVQTFRGLRISSSHGFHGFGDVPQVPAKFAHHLQSWRRLHPGWIESWTSVTGQQDTSGHDRFSSGVIHAASWFLLIPVSLLLSSPHFRLKIGTLNSGMITQAWILSGAEIRVLWTMALQIPFLSMICNRKSEEFQPKSTQHFLKPSEKKMLAHSKVENSWQRSWNPSDVGNISGSDSNWILETQLFGPIFFVFHAIHSMFSAHLSTMWPCETQGTQSTCGNTTECADARGS